MTLEPQQLANLLLPDWQPYVVLQSDNPPASLAMPNAMGCTGRTADMLACDWLKSRGEWRGRQPLIWIHDVVIRELCAAEAKGDEAQAAEWERQMLLGVICHEVGHIAEKRVDESEPSPNLHRYAEAIAAYSAIAPRNPARPPFDGHPATFIRLAIHAAYRSGQAGCAFPINFLFNGAAYGLPVEPQDFEYALGNEPIRLAGESLFDIRSFCAPFHFRKLWNRCVRYWISQQPSESPAVAQATSMLESEELR